VLKAGDEQRWQALLAEQISENGRLYFRLAYGVLRDASAAEDMCQQAFLKAWKHREMIRDRQMLRHWLARVVINESLQMLRRSRLERDALHRRPIYGMADVQDGPALRESVVRAMGELPEAERVVVALRVMEGMSGNEVKALLGCSAAQVSKQLHSGMQRLRLLLEDWREEAGGALRGVSRSSGAGQ
jgi:RNA polymerase sigma-70 factor, ECF subfamily